MEKKKDWVDRFNDIKTADDQFSIRGRLWKDKHYFKIPSHGTRLISTHLPQSKENPEEGGKARTSDEGGITILAQLWFWHLFTLHVAARVALFLFPSFLLPQRPSSTLQNSLPSTQTEFVQLSNSLAARALVPRQGTTCCHMWLMQSSERWSK